ncbi:hypothetical protein ACI782_19085 [Geodermatophilus sp. SYSU D00703]
MQRAHPPPPVRRGRLHAVELVIRHLLTESGADLAEPPFVSVAGEGIEAAADWDHQESGETHLGDARTTDFASPTRDFTHPFAMTYPAHAFRTDEPTPQIHVRHLRFCDDAGRTKAQCPTGSSGETGFGVLE